MIEFAWSGGDLFYRERSFQVDASGSFCGVTAFGEWKKVPTLHEFPPQDAVDREGEPKRLRKALRTVLTAKTLAEAKEAARCEIEWHVDG